VAIGDIWLLNVGMAKINHFRRKRPVAQYLVSFGESNEKLANMVT